MKLLTKIVLAFIVVINLGGCSWNSFLFSSKSENPVVLIDSPPMRMIYAGNFTKKDRQMFKEVLLQINKMPDKNHTYSFPLGAEISINKKDTMSASSTFTSAPKEK